jgi:hypothetical protein
MLLVPTRSTNRELRILRNLMDKNAIWEKVGHEYFVQFDEQSGKELRIAPDELKHLTTCGWIRLVRPPRSAQRLDFYELTDEGSALDDVIRRKSVQREFEPLQQRRRRHA